MKSTLFTVTVATLASVGLFSVLARRWFRGCTFGRGRHKHSRQQRKSSSPPAVLWEGAEELIGNTPMIRLPRLSAQLGTTVLCKCEFMNPGGTPKDRIAQAIIADAEQSGQLGFDTGNRTVYEGTVGSTGIALAWLCAVKGYRCVITIPDDMAKEKFAMLQALGASVKPCRPAPITDRNHFVRYAQDLANGSKQEPGYAQGYFANQFENLANFRAHFERTGPEIYEQTGGHIDALILGGGTGGTLAGCCRYLKPKCPGMLVCLADPQGSGLYNKVRNNVFFTREEAEGKRRRHQVDTIVEGVGLQRMTRNLEMVLGRAQNIIGTDDALDYLDSDYEDSSRRLLADPPQQSPSVTRWIDDAIKVTDREAVLMARYMVRHEGLFLGSSSCINLVAVVKLVRRWQRDEGRQTERLQVVTMLCDSGYRHLTKFWSDQFLIDCGLFSTEELQPEKLAKTVETLDFIEM